jgi:cyclohexanone monooxygenase
LLREGVDEESSIEQRVDWIADCIAYLRAQGRERIEATPAAEDAWVAYVNDVANLTLYPSCNSWYLGANVPGKPRVFMPHLGFPPYVEKCSELAAKGYEGFALGRATGFGLELRDFSRARRSRSWALSRARGHRVR